MKTMKLALLSGVLFLGTEHIMIASAKSAVQGSTTAQKQEFAGVHREEKKSPESLPSEKKAKQARFYANQAKDLAMQSEKTAKLAQANLDKAKELLAESVEMRKEEDAKAGKKASVVGVKVPEVKENIEAKTGGKLKTAAQTTLANIQAKTGDKLMTEKQSEVAKKQARLASIETTTGGAGLDAVTTAKQTEVTNKQTEVADIDNKMADSSN